MSCATHCVEEEAFDDIQCLYTSHEYMVCASVIIFMRSVYTIAYFDTPIMHFYWFFVSAPECRDFVLALVRRRRRRRPH